MSNERHNSFSMHGMQEQKLFKHEEQEEHYRQDTTEEVLQKLQTPYDAQRDKGVKKVNSVSRKCRNSRKMEHRRLVALTLVTDTGYRPVALTARASDSKSEGWGFESLLACQKNIMYEDKKRGHKEL